MVPNEDGLVPVGPFGVECWDCCADGPVLRRQLSEPLTDIWNNGGLRGGGGVHYLHPPVGGTTHPDGSVTWHLPEGDKRF